MRTNQTSGPVGSQIAGAIRTWAEDSTQEIVELTRALVEQETPSDVPAAHAGIQEIISRQLTDCGLSVRKVEGVATAGHLVGEWMPHSPTGTQLLIGHWDTVWDLGTLAQRPFMVDGSEISGPGVYDMKAGLAQMIFALRALRALRLQPTLQPVVFVNSDEEIGSSESRAALAELASQAERAFVLEPSLGVEGKLKTARKGSGAYEITVRGRAAHAGLDPTAGRSAILELSYIIQNLFELNDPSRGVSVNVGTVDGGLRPNVVAPVSRASVDVRVPTWPDAERVDSAIRSLQPNDPDVTIEVQGGMSRPPLERSARNQRLRDAAFEIGGAMGVTLTEGLAGGSSDGNLVSIHTATLDGLGPVGDGAHAEHEHALIDRLAERTALLALLLLHPEARPR